MSVIDQCPLPENCTGVLSETFFELLGKYLNNRKISQYTGTWRHFGQILVGHRYDELELDEIERRAQSDGKNNPTWSVYQKFLQLRKENAVNIHKLWDVLHNQMERHDAASCLVDSYYNNTVFLPQPEQLDGGDVLSIASHAQSSSVQHNPLVQSSSVQHENKEECRGDSLFPRGQSPSSFSEVSAAHILQGQHAEDAVQSRFGFCPDSWNCSCGGPGCGSYAELRSTISTLRSNGQQRAPCPSLHGTFRCESHERDAFSAVGDTSEWTVGCENHSTQDDPNSSSETLVPQQSHSVRRGICTGSVQSQATGYACQPSSAAAGGIQSGQAPRHILNNLHQQNDPVVTLTTEYGQPCSATPPIPHQVTNNGARNLYRQSHSPGAHSSAAVNTACPVQPPTSALRGSKSDQASRNKSCLHQRQMAVNDQNFSRTPHVNMSYQVPRSGLYDQQRRDQHAAAVTTAHDQLFTLELCGGTSYQVPPNSMNGLHHQDHPSEQPSSAFPQGCTPHSPVSENSLPSAQDHSLMTVNYATLGQHPSISPYANESHQVPRDFAYRLNPQSHPTGITTSDGQHHSAILQRSKPYSGQEDGSLLKQDYQFSPAFDCQPALLIGRNESQRVHPSSCSTLTAGHSPSNYTLQNNGQSIPGSPNSQRCHPLRSHPPCLSDDNSPTQSSPVMSRTLGTMDVSPEESQLVPRGCKLHRTSSYSPLARGGSLNYPPSSAAVGLRNAQGTSNIFPFSSMGRHAPIPSDFHPNVPASWHQRSSSKWRRQDSQGSSDVTSEATDDESEETVVGDPAEPANEWETAESGTMTHPRLYRARDNLRIPQIARRCVVGISFEDQDLPLATRVSSTLERNGCTTRMIDRSTMRHISEMDAIVLIYTHNYQKKVLDKKFFLVVPCTRFVYDRLTEEYRSNGQRNRRCVFYPEMAKVAKSRHFPSMFLQHPSQPEAFAVYCCLYDVMPPGP